MSLSHPNSSTPQTLAAATAAALAKHASQSFGLMGNGNAHLIDHLGAAGVPYTAVRHEAATVAAADAYARVSGKMAIATTTYGAGFTNTITALAEAAQARTPMLLVVGDSPSSGPRPWDVDEEMLSAAIGVRLFTLGVAKVAETVDRAAAYALRMRRPVVLGLPYDLVNAPVSEPTPAAHAPVAAAAAPQAIDLSDPAMLAELTRSVADHAPAAHPAATPATSMLPGAIASSSTVPAAHRIVAAADALAGAARPLIIAGHGAHLASAATELGELAERLGALTATTALARSIFPDSRYDLGIAGGFGQAEAMATIQQADVVLVVGAGLNQFTMRFGELFGEGTVVIRVDTEQVAAPKTQHPITHQLLQGGARETLRAIAGELTSALAARTDVSRAPGGWRAEVAGLEPGGALRIRPVGDTELCSDGLLDPRAVASRLADLLPENRHVTSDGGHFLAWANMFWPVASPERMIMVGTAYQTIGLGFCTVPGVAAAAPDSTVVLTTGDGGGLMALADLESAIRTARSQVIVVWNDSAYSAEVHLYGVMGLDTAPMLIPTVNFAGVASALGATGVVVNTLADLAALEAWTAGGAAGTILLDCRVSGTVVADYQREVQKANGLDLPETTA
ncbi:thiamine pyrophosphate-binding protein [Leucobacter komagatae]|uniref:Thiamine pyrophosphate-binding protein n=1 Tax=Leucobacter komagatae TaxID=55969 RepID=A0A0D0I045_9MICO|nr:thiamine pyrophosphate-binding protein [Leucobacter komagatae]KIP53191.1 thiamine pyrophosphate-binding protein [Leucobacter komagatae]